MRRLYLLLQHGRKYNHPHGTQTTYTLAGELSTNPAIPEASKVPTPLSTNTDQVIDSAGPTSSATQAIPVAMTTTTTSCELRFLAENLICLLAVYLRRAARARYSSYLASASSSASFCSESVWISENVTGLCGNRHRPT